MKMRAKAILKAFTPPILLKLKTRLLNPTRIAFQGIFDDFQQVPDDKVWQSEEWLTLSRAKLAKSLGLKFPPGRDYLDSLLLLINLESATKDCRVLDFGGGTGFCFSRLHRKFTTPSYVKWMVVDSPVLMEIGKQSLNQHKIEFHESISAIDAAEIVFINTSVQYFPDWKIVFSQLLALKPKYFVLNRLLCSETKTVVAQQTILGKRSPCVFVSSRKLLEFMGGGGYVLIQKMRCWEEDLSSAISKELKEIIGETPSHDFIFMRSIQSHV